MRAWTVVSATVAPMALAGGWTLAAAREPESYDATRDTLSALASRGAVDPQVMTAALALVGACHLATAAGLVEAGRPARLVLGLGGAATVAVAALPQPEEAHLPAAVIAFLALAVWPLLSRRPSRRIALGAGAVLLGLDAVLLLSLRADLLVGTAERVAALGQAGWPLAVAVGVRRRPPACRA